ncbi:MAG: ABC transporter permease [Acidobacteriia bacterium]|nr:ABC transporter permease [Terriglobia bacterium]
MRVLFTIAWRNIWRHTRRTLLTVGTVALGLMLLLLSVGLGDGGHYQMIDSAVRLGSGHVVIQAPGYQQSRGVAKLIDGGAQRRALAMLDTVHDRFAIRTVLRRVFASGLAASAEDSAGVQMIGIEPAREEAVSRFAEKLVEGRFLESDDSDDVVLGSGVARRLALRPGDKLVLTVQEVGGAELQSMLVHVGGVMRTGMEDFDESVLLLPLVTAQRFFRMGEGVHQVAMLIADSRLAEPLARLGREQLPGLDVLTWAQALPELNDFIRVDDAGNYLFNTVFFVLIAFLVLNTLLMSVLERKREFALLDALGLTPDRRFSMIMLEAGFIALLSAAFGAALGLLGHLYFAVHGMPIDWFYSGEISAAGVAFDPVIYSNLSGNRILGCIGLVFLLTLLLALIPARRAARPAEAYLLGRT